MPDPERFVVLGIVAKAHGTRGEVAVSADEGVVEDLLSHETLFLRRPGKPAEQRRVESARGVPRGVLIAFEGIGDREQAEALRGCEVVVPRSWLEAEDEYYSGDLIGLKAVTPEGQALGSVRELQEAGDIPTLVIRGQRQWLVPLVDVFVKKIDLQAGEIVIVPPEEE